MPLLPRLTSLWRNLFRQVRREQELTAELDAYLEMLVEQKIKEGLDPAAARRAALVEFGGKEQVKEQVREVRMGYWLDTVWQDVRYALRMLRKQPGFTLIAIVTLALGIGANTAIFSVVNAVLLRPLPFKEPSQLVMVWNRGPKDAGGDRTPLAVADLLDWRAQNRTCENVEAFRYNSYTWLGGESPVQVPAADVTANFFGTLGVQPILGRAFLPDEEKPGAPRSVVIGERFWRTRLAADSRVLGRALNLGGNSFTIIGVLPASFEFPAKDVELWAALQLERPTRRGPYFLTGVARLKPGAALTQAGAEMNAMKSTLAGDQISFHALPINDFIVGEVRLALVVLLAAVTLVLLIAVANVANLLLTRASLRRHEMAIRTALGAGRGRLIRQLLTESLLLASAGGLLGVLWAQSGLKLLLKLAPEDLPRLEQVSLDVRTLGWTALVTLMTGVLFGLAPAWQGVGLNLSEAFKEGGRGATAHPGWRRNLLVISELTLAVMLLIGAGLLLKSFWRLQQVDPGINPHQVLTMELLLPRARYGAAAQINPFYQQLRERVGALPGVQTVAMSGSLPPNGMQYSDDFMVEGRPIAPGAPPPVAGMALVSHEYFTALGIPLRRGRYFTAADNRDAPGVMLINETLARQLFPNEDPLGKRINMADIGNPVYSEIIGIVGDVKYKGLGAETQPTLYQPILQNSSRGIYLIVKTQTPHPLALAAAVRQEVLSLDSQLPITGISTLEQRLYSSVAQPRFRTMLIALFAALALVLAGLGIYGVLAYAVAQRTHEIGIRLALGAQQRQVLRLVIGQGIKLVVIGAAIGLAAALTLTRLMQDLLFEVSPTDPLTFAGVAMLLTIVALLACWIPARRATKVDPLVALRHD